MDVYGPQCDNSQALTQHSLSYVGMYRTNIHADLYVDVYRSNIQADLASKEKFEPRSPKWTEKYLFTYSFVYL